MNVALQWQGEIFYFSVPQIMAMECAPQFILFKVQIGLLEELVATNHLVKKARLGHELVRS